MSDANAEQREYWNSDEGAVWVRDETRYDEMLAPFTAALLDAAAPTAGTTVLDVGCGTGATTLAAARMVGDAPVTGVDISRPMVEGARRRAERDGITNATFEVHDAQVDPFATTVDLLISRFGVMFFEDPVAAFVNLHGAVTPGGRVTFVCWQPLFANEWMTVPALAVAEHVPLPEPAGPGTPGPFAFGDAEHVRAILDGAGFSDVSITPLETSILLGGNGSPEDAVEFLSRTGMGRLILSNAADDVRDRALQSLRDAIAPHHDGEGIRLNSATWIVTAVRP